MRSHTKQYNTPMEQVLPQGLQKSIIVYSKHYKYHVFHIYSVNVHSDSSVLERTRLVYNCVRI